MPDSTALRYEVLGISERPRQYAEGKAYFRHLELMVDERVLIPRPETEVVVDWALRLAGAAGGIAVDVGTGSGAIALALAQEGSFDRVVATDVSSDALDVARANLESVARTLRSPVELRLGSFLAPVMDIGAALLVSNPPYIASTELQSLPANVRGWEPPLALLSGDDGMAATATIIEGAHRVLAPGGWLVMETDSTRARAAQALVLAAGRFSDVAVHADLTGRDRVLVARLAG
ncbi:MAG TPA: HemK/PrmC family methyltransferase [Gemmatimonadaceae bacterium]|nr:HemK/PrmC family methyltransferase [Gemmatimonadaceae bacterium]